MAVAIIAEDYDGDDGNKNQLCDGSDHDHGDKDSDDGNGGVNDEKSSSNKDGDDDVSADNPNSSEDGDSNDNGNDHSNDNENGADYRGVEILVCKGIIAQGFSEIFVAPNSGYQIL